MGQKVHPIGVRIGYIKDWNSKWYANSKDFGDLLVEDYNIRKIVKKKLFAAGISKIAIERNQNKIKLNISTAKPGIVIGKGGVLIEGLKKELGTKFNREFMIDIIEIRNPEINAQLIAENIAAQLEKRISFRKAMKQAMARAMKSGAKGIKTNVSGRLGGTDIARSEHYHEGTIPLQTLRADIDYGFHEANTTFGKIGVKVWVYNGEILPTAKRNQNENVQERREFKPRSAEGGKNNVDTKKN